MGSNSFSEVAGRFEWMLGGEGRAPGEDVDAGRSLLLEPRSDPGCLRDRRRGRRMGPS